MKLPTKAQYAFSLVLHIQQNGRSKLLDVSKTHLLSLPFLEQVARDLRLAGVIQSVRGPGGGYELREAPTIGQVLAAMDAQPFSNPTDPLTNLFHSAVAPILNEPVSTLREAA